ncbi:hypothetical protein [Ferrigenium sp. UT5]|uniref:hypothetical protein n=1 Tax=Ferrigenium sp. UT5 TaxID=3242105 RepID=UPI003550F755
MGVVMQVRNIVSGITVVSLLAGCSLFGIGQSDYTAGAVAVQPLEVPPDLVAPATATPLESAAPDGTRVASYSDFAHAPKGPVAPCVAPAPLVVPAQAQPMPAKLMKVGATHFILLSEPFERAWRTVDVALTQAAIKPMDRDRSKGVYFLKIGDKAKSKSEAQLHVVETAGVSVVTVEGAPQDAAARLLESLQQRMVP